MSPAPSFDFAALITACARWPRVPVPTEVAADSLLERVRQVLARLEVRPEPVAADLMPLLRQALLRRAVPEGDSQWLRVPTAAGWPLATQWRDSQFDVLDDGDALHIRARQPRLSFLDEQADLFDDAFAGIEARPRSHIRADPLMERLLGRPTYTGEGQREAVRALLHLPPDETLIANLPTGSGKSVLMQIPALLGPESSLTLAIVPTVALAIDQGARMARLLADRYPLHEMPPLAYHGGLKSEQRQSVWRAIRAGTQPILFTSPENATGSLRGPLEDAAATGRLSHIVIDEAHLVVGWGNGFRPAFQLLPALVHRLKERAEGRPLRVVLASATLTPATTDTLRHLFGPPEKTYVVAAVHLRPEPRYAFRHGDSDGIKAECVLEAVRLAPRPFILYVTRPDEAEWWLRKLSEVGFGRIAKFTGRTPSEARETLLDAWKANALDGMIATSAFGLGVDKSDVRTIIHATMPESLDRFYQEVGRGGRDGRASASLLLFTDDDVEQARSLATDKLIRDDTGFERWKLMIDHAQRDLDRAEVHWLDLALLPPHLKVASEASSLWNVRTLTLMARAGLLELIALKSDARGGGTDEVPVELDLATRAAVRILDDGHRREDTFARRMQAAREQVWSASRRGVDSMESVARRRVEIADALKTTYAFIRDGAWCPVTPCCGGCPDHWSERRQTVRYRPPPAPRLQRFAHRGLDDFYHLALPRAAAHLLLVDAANDSAYEGTCAALAGALFTVVRPHTWAVDTGMVTRFLPELKRTLSLWTADDAFIDIINNDTYDWLGGDGEVRVLFLDRHRASVVHSNLWLSAATLDILVVPSDLPHPQNERRRFIDTTPHVHADDLLDRLTS